jgi:crotonobetaine/carnitine-CoA ligase
VGAYGLTDVGHIMWKFVHRAGVDAPPGTCGLPTDGFECRLVDELDQPVAPGEVGELVCRPLAPWSTSLGYWERPGATLKAWRNLWLHTGDLLRMDDAGWYYFVDRKKDVIRRKGENISSVEVENTCMQLPGVAECAAYGIESLLSEEDVAIALVPEDAAAIRPEEILQELTGELPQYAMPSYIRVLDDLPKTSTGKVRKEILRAEGITDDTYVRPAAPSTAPKR